MHEIKVKYALETRYSTDSNSEDTTYQAFDMHLAIGQMTKISCTDGGYQPSSDVFMPPQLVWGVPSSNC